MDKRTFLKTSLFSTAGLFLYKKSVTGSNQVHLNSPVSGEFVQEPLGYGYNALEPWIDAMTMEIHYSKHHAAYTKNLNSALAEIKASPANIESLMAGISGYPIAVRNNAGGFYNHNLYWKIMTPGGRKEPSGELAEAINKTFSSFGSFKDEFSKKAMGVFGSGWTWLIENKGLVKIVNSSNQDNTLMDISTEKGNPILCIDIWEHAYYLKYQNRRKEYVDNFWNVINWDIVANLYRHNHA